MIIHAREFVRGRQVYFLLVQIAGLVWVWHWWRNLPDPGYVALIVTALAVIMSWHGDMTVLHRAIWLLVLGAYLALGFRAISNDRADFAKKEANRQKDENQQFQNIASGIDRSIQGSQKQFVAEVDGLTNNLNTLTGGESFCYLMPGPGQDSVGFIHVGKFPLYDVSARIGELDQNGRLKHGNLTDVIVPVGDMIKGHITLRPFPWALEGPPNVFNANVFFTARNGDWTELLRERQVNGRFMRAMRVIGRFTTLKKEKTLCETIDSGYPRESNGDIDGEFRSEPSVPRCP